MLFKKKLLVAAITSSFLSLPVLAELSLDTDSITSTNQTNPTAEVSSPTWGDVYSIGAPIPIDFIVPDKIQLRSISIRGQDKIPLPQLKSGDRFQGKLYGATDVRGYNQVIIEFYNPEYGQYGISERPIQYDVVSASDLPQTPTLKVFSPADGDILQQGDPVSIRFKLPNLNFFISSVELNGRKTRIDWIDVAPDSIFDQAFYGFTNESGPLKVVFNSSRIADGKTFSVERNLTVQRTGFAPMSIRSPIEDYYYQKGKAIPIEVTPSSNNKNPRFVVYFNDKQITEMTQEPYRFDYLVTQESDTYYVRVEEYDEDLYLTDQIVQVKFFATPPNPPIPPNPATIRLKTTLEITNGTSAVPEGDSITMVADVKAYSGDQEMANSELKSKIQTVEFYVNGEFAASDKEAPYTFTRRYTNDQKSLTKYATPYQITTKVKVNDSSIQVDNSPTQSIEALPALGANYCSTRAKVWSQNQSYQGGDIVQDKGFFYRSNASQQGSRPDPSINSSDPNSPASWVEQLCGNDILPKTGITIITKGRIHAQLGKNVDITGRYSPPQQDITLDRLVMLDEGTGKQTQIPTTPERGFSFKYLFEGKSSCFYTKCDIINLYAINNLGYANSGVIGIEANTAPEIDYLNAQRESNRVIVNFYGRDDSDTVIASIYHPKTKKLITSKEIEVRSGFIKNFYEGVLSFNKPSDTDTFLFEVKDNAGGKVQKDIHLK